MIYAAISACVMILVITFIRMLFLKRLPKQCFRLLWVLAAIRLILPFSLTLEVELENELIEPPRTVVIDTLDGVSDKNGIQGEPVGGQMHFNLTEIIPYILPLGTLICGGFLTTAYLRMRRVALSGCRIADKSFNGVSVRAGDGASTPFSCGVLHPIIFIPTQMLPLGERLDTVIAHERQHIKSGDQLVKWLIAAAVCMHWYNPLVWLMWQLANRDIELACDEAVVRSGTNNADYAMAIIDAASVNSTATVCSFGAPALNERIECIMKSKKLTVCGFVSAALILGAMSVFFVQVTAARSDEEYSAPDTAGTVDTYELLPDSYLNGEEREPELDIYVNGEEYDGSADINGEDLDVYISGAEHEKAPDIYVNGEEYIFEDIEVVPEPSVEAESFTLTCPLAEYTAITGRFGMHATPVGTEYFSNGVNVAAASGAAVYAAASGEVITAEYDPTNGNYIVIDHGSGVETVYRHLSAMNISVGDTVEAGAEIGTVGATGCVTGPNLGFSIISNGTYVSPESLFE